MEGLGSDERDGVCLSLTKLRTCFQRFCFYLTREVPCRLVISTIVQNHEKLKALIGCFNL